MFCRFCGSHVLDDSLFCAKCGKRLRGSGNPRLEKIIRVLFLRTPYPYAIALFILAAVWLLMPRGVPPDYTGLKWTIEANRKLDLPDENLFQQSFSLILENSGTKAVKDIPVDVSARIDPPQPAQIAATFHGDRVPIVEDGKAQPLKVILTDEVRPGNKRSFLLEGSIQAQPPFKVVYEVREEDSEAVLASFVVER